MALLRTTTKAGFLLESWRATRVRFDAIWRQLTYALLRCGVPRKMMSFVRSRIFSDRHMVCIMLNSVWHTQKNHGESTSLTMMPPRLCTTNAIGCCQAVRNCSKLTNCRHRTLSSISLSRLTDRLITKSAAWCVLVVASNAGVFITAVTAYDCTAKRFSDDKTLGFH